ncbi:MAG: S-layer homology domain-containing protein [Oscillospiraceae bacterium]|nr:S-layer homology domain-containing protein [Oscillospiraceae bacterium]
MKRVLTFMLALLMLLSILPVSVRADEIDTEDPIVDYGVFMGNDGAGIIEPMGSGKELTYEMADIPEGGSYKNMSASQEIIDLIKDFEGFSATAYWDKKQWTVGYGTRCSGPDVTVTRAEAEKLLREMIDDDFEPIVNNFCKKNGKQPTQQQFDAMLDLTFNNGGSWTTGSAVPNVVLNPSTALDVVKGFGAWSRSGGSVSYVHVNRRIREALIYLYGEYYLAYGGQDCKSDLEIVSNDDLPHFKVVIFKTNSGTLSTGKTDYAAYYPVGDYYRSFMDAERDGYSLVGWKITRRSNEKVSDGERLSIYDKVEENLELTAVWEKGNVTVDPGEPPVDFDDPFEPTDPEPTEPGMEEMPDVEIDMDRLPFVDVPENTWYRDAVSYVYRNGLMNGTSATTFTPGGSMTRGMLVTVLWRLDGEVPVSNEERACFEDIGGAWYTDAVAWAYSNGIVNGVSATRFEPNRIVTRQEAVTIFHRYCVDTSLMSAGSTAELKGFADKDSVQAWAGDAFVWAVNTGLIEGSVSGGKVYLNPNDHLNRAQAAILLQRCVEDIL